MKCYAGYSCSESLIQNASSGGITSAIAQYFVKRDFVVFGVKYTDDYKNVQYSYATTLNELLPFMGSKYVKANVGTVLNIIPTFLDQGKKVLFVGLPCDTFVVKKKVEQYNPKHLQNLYLIDMICSGAVKREVLEDFVKYLEAKYKSKINSLTMRKKCPNWVPPFFYAYFENGKEYKERLYRTDFGLALSNMLNEGCYSCNLRGENRCSDITVGDMWGIDATHDAYNPKGVSVAIANTEKGERLLVEVQDLNLYEVEIEDVIKGNPRYLSPSVRPSNYEKFRQTFRNKGLHFACIQSMGFKKIILYGLRNCSR